jgi:hypothetical protein
VRSLSSLFHLNTCRHFLLLSVVPATTKFDDDLKPRRGLTRATNTVGKVYEKTKFLWVLAIVAFVALQAAREFGQSANLENTFQWIEIGLTIAFDVEIAIRIFACLPDWRSFFSESVNKVDLFLAVVTSIIQIPAIRTSHAYPWLSGFEIARCASFPPSLRFPSLLTFPHPSRFYRVILFIPRIRSLLVRSSPSVLPPSSGC